ALTTGAIWAQVLLGGEGWLNSHGTPPPGNHPRPLGGWEICSNWAQFILAVRRAGGALLDLIVVTPESVIIRDPSGIQGPIPRLRSLRVTTGFESGAIQEIDPFDIFDFSALESFEIQDFAYTTLVQKAAEEARNLRRLTLPSMYLGEA